MDTERERRAVVATSPNVVGRTIAQFRPIHNFGVTVSRITRQNFEFVPRMSDEIEHGDTLLVVGEPDNIEKFAEFAGHRERTLHETDMLSLGVGIIAGIALGLVSFGLGGGGFSLGLAGGPLFVALVLGHFGRVGPIVGYLPPAAQLMLTETGLAFFLADAGVRAGATVVSVITDYGQAVCLAALVVTLLPMIFGYFLGRFGLGMNLLQVIGGVCGGMTSTPGLGVITARTDSDIPVVSYAAAYPVALILMTVFAHALVALLG